jgi:hypothetical protein
MKVNRAQELIIWKKLFNCHKKRGSLHTEIQL